MLKKTKIFIVFGLVVLFSLGLLLIDYGATFKDSRIVMQSLLFEEISPRITYHTGIIIIIAVFLILSIMFIDEVLI